jgi:hypothetical protein
MTLKEKITDEYIWTTEPIVDAEEVSESVDKMIEIAEEFAIGFAEWFWYHGRKYWRGERTDYLDMSEILEIYKKEKGL